MRGWGAALILGLVVCCADASSVSAEDPRIAEAFDLLEVDDVDRAMDLAQAALEAASERDDQMRAREVLAIIAYLTDTPERAIATLRDFDSRTVAAYGWRDEGRITMLERLMVLYEEVGDTGAARIAALQQAHLVRGAEGWGDSLPYYLIAAARLELEVGDPRAAAMMAMEAALLAGESGGTEAEQVDEALLLMARAHLSLDAPVRALAWSDMIGDGQVRAMFEAALSDYATRSAAGKDHLQQWRDAAKAMALAEVQEDTQLRIGLFADAFSQGYLEVAEQIAQDLRASAHFTDITPLLLCEALALHLSDPVSERAIPWLNCLTDYPPATLATRGDLVDAVRGAEKWLAAKGRQSDALPLLRMAHAITRLVQGADSYAALGLMGLEADALMSARDFAVAGAVLAQMRDAPALMEMPDLRFQAMILQGELYTLLNRPKDAETAFRATAALFESGAVARDDRWTAVLELTANARLSQGDLEGGVALFEQALAHEAALGDAFSRRALFVRLNLAAALTRLGRSQEALRLFEEARSVLENNDALDANLIAAFKLLYAEVLEDAGQSEAARDERAAAQADTGSSTDQVGLMVLAKTQAGLAWARGDLQAAERFADEAIALSSPDDPDLDQALNIRARVAARQGDDVVALDLLRRLASEAHKPGRGRADELREVLPLYLEVIIRLAQATPDPASTRYLAEGFEVAQEYKSLSAGAAVAQAALRWQSAPELAKVLRQTQDSAAAIEALNSRYRTALSAGNNLAGISQDLAAAAQRHAALKARVAVQFPEYEQLFGATTVSPGTIAAQLGPDEVLLLFVTSDDDNGRGTASSTIMGLTHEAIMSGGTLPRADLEELALALRCQAALTDPNCADVGSGTRGAFALGGEEDETPIAPPFDLGLAHRAYEVLLEPMEPILEGKSRLIIVPDPSLVSVPFHTLVRSAPDADTTVRTADWLIRDTSIFVVPTVAALSALRSQPPSMQGGRFLGIGDPLIGRQSGGPVPYDCGQTPVLFAAATPTGRRSAAAGVDAIAGLAALPDTRCELRAAAAYFGADSTLLLHGDATESRIRALNRSGELAQYQTISFATHGLIAGELSANEAGIVLTPPQASTEEDDGLLTTGDIAQLTLNADMVLLSACNTAAGSRDNDEGLSGLASAFFYAGARSILVSHWPVYSDAATRLTTGTLARRDADPTLGYADALRLTMLSVLDDPTSDDRQLHPAYWAPFMVVGEGATGG